MGRPEQHIKELVLSKVAKCGQCGGEYGHSDVNVLGHKEDLWFLMLICGQCHQAVGVAAVVKEQSAGAAAGGGGEWPRDRESEPAGSAAARDAPTAQSQPVTGEDVAAVRDFLKDFDGDFRRLFQNR